MEPRDYFQRIGQTILEMLLQPLRYVRGKLLGQLVVDLCRSFTAGEGKQQRLIGHPRHLHHGLMALARRHMLEHITAHDDGTLTVGEGQSERRADNGAM